MVGLSRKDFQPRSPEDKAVDWLAHLGTAAERKWKTADGANVTITNPAASGNRVSFHAKVVAADGTVMFDDDHVIVNPPLYATDGGQDADGNPTFAKNIRILLRGIVERNVK